MNGKVLTLNEKDEIINEEKIDMADTQHYWNRKDEFGNRYYIVSDNGFNPYKKKYKKLEKFKDNA